MIQSSDSFGTIPQYIGRFVGVSKKLLHVDLVPEFCWNCLVHIMTNHLMENSNLSLFLFLFGLEQNGIVANGG
jgi:hypothetical protein